MKFIHSVDNIILKTQTFRIIMNSRYIVAVGKHIASQEPLPCTRKGIRIDKPADAGIVITALEVAEPGFSGITVAMVFFTGII